MGGRGGYVESTGSNCYIQPSGIRGHVASEFANSSYPRNACHLAQDLQVPVGLSPIPLPPLWRPSPSEMVSLTALKECDFDCAPLDDFGSVHFCGSSEKESECLLFFAGPPFSGGNTKKPKEAEWQGWLPPPPLATPQIPARPQAPPPPGAPGTSPGSRR